MKKAMLLLASVLAVFCVLGCATTSKEVIGADGTPRPDWVKKMSKKAEDVHYEVGYGKGTNYSTSMKKAEADGRTKISRWLKTDVDSVMKTYTQDAGIGEETELIEFMEEVSMQTTENSISGAEIEDTWEDIEGGVYVLMVYDINFAAENLQKTISSYARNEAAAFAEFKADEAFKQLQESKAE